MVQRLLTFHIFVPNTTNDNKYEFCLLTWSLQIKLSMPSQLGEILNRYLGFPVQNYH